MARRELATAIVSDTILTVYRTDDAHYNLKVEYPNPDGQVGGVWETASLDVRDVFTRMGQEVRLLLHQEGVYTEQEKQFLDIMARQRQDPDASVESGL